MQEHMQHPGIRYTVMGVFLFLALFLLGETISVFEGIAHPTAAAANTITVNGTGQASMAPDVAHISFSVENTSATVSDAQSKTTTQANAAIAYAKSQGIADKDIRTLSYNVTPQYSYPNCGPGIYCPSSNGKITGYQVSETIQLTVRNLDNTGTVIGGLGNLQVQNISGPDLTLDDPTAGYDAARADAITNAKTQADTLAKQLGVHLGRIVSFSESSGGGYPVPMYAAMGAAKSADAVASPTIPTGENQYNANVSITYEID